MNVKWLDSSIESMLAMQEWHDVNPLAEWLEQTVEITGNMDDYVTIPQLKTMWKSTANAVGASMFSKSAKAYFQGIGDRVRFKEVDKPADAQSSIRGVVRGVRYKDS